MIQEFLKKYTRWTQEMWFVYQEEYKSYAIMGLGISGEAGEIAELIFNNPYRKLPDTDNYIKELGDVLYYWGILNHTLELSVEKDVVYSGHRNQFPTQEVLEHHASKLMIACAKVSEILKKNVRDEKLDREKIKQALLGVIHEWLALVAASSFDWQQVIELNIMKLEDRKNRNVLSGSGDNR